MKRCRASISSSKLLTHIENCSITIHHKKIADYLSTFQFLMKRIQQKIRGQTIDKIMAQPAGVAKSQENHHIKTAHRIPSDLHVHILHLVHFQSCSFLSAVILILGDALYAMKIKDWDLGLLEMWWMQTQSRIMETKVSTILVGLEPWISGELINDWGTKIIPLDYISAKMITLSFRV